MIIDGWDTAKTDLPLVIVGNYNHGHGKKIYREYSRIEDIKFLGGVYDQSLLNNLRHFARAVFHGHSVGGTNPSLLEAMASGAPVLAHKNQFNCSILGDNAIYFRSSSDIKRILPELEKLMVSAEQMVNNNLEKVRIHYRWDSIVDQYEDLFIRSLKG
jgi:glycosyltransferase involved in cell wall biosynthesis